MPHTIQQTVYRYSELSPSAQEKARNWWREGFAEDGYDWWDCTVGDAVRMGELLGIEFDKRHGSNHQPAIFFSGFCSQGDGACFNGSYRYRRGALANMRSEAPQDKELHRIATVLQNVQRRHFYGISAVVSDGAGSNYHSHEMTRRIDVEDRNGDSIDDASEETVKEALRDFMRWIYRQLESEWDYLNSDEQVAENIEANEYEFTEDGGRA